jgi:hypothetical protein
MQYRIAGSLALSFLFVGCAAAPTPAPLFSDADTARMKAEIADRDTAAQERFRAPVPVQSGTTVVLRDVLLDEAHAQQDARRQSALALLATIGENLVRGGFKCGPIEDDVFVALDCEAKETAEGFRPAHFVGVRLSTGASEMRTYSWDEYRKRRFGVEADLTQANAAYKQDLARGTKTFHEGVPLTPEQEALLAEHQGGGAAARAQRAADEKLENEARQHCRWENKAAHEMVPVPGVSTPGVYREVFSGFVSSKPVCDKKTRPEVLRAAVRIANRMMSPTP